MSGIPATWFVDEDGEGHLTVWDAPGDFPKAILLRRHNPPVFDVLRDLIEARDAARGRA